MTDQIRDRRLIQHRLEISQPRQIVMGINFLHIPTRAAPPVAHKRIFPPRNVCLPRAPMPVVSAPSAGMAELVDAPDLGSGIERCAGSSPVPGTFGENLKSDHNRLIFNQIRGKLSFSSIFRASSEMRQNAPNCRFYCRNRCGKDPLSGCFHPRARPRNMNDETHMGGTTL